MDLNDDRQYFVSQLIDGSRKSWLGRDFLIPLLDVLNSPHVSTNVLKQLAEDEFIFFAPDRNFVGRVFDISPTTERIVYLSPELLEPSHDIRAVIAHELAHLFLRHEEAPIPSESASVTARRNEQEADKLAESWGFKLPPSYTDRL